MAIHVEEYLKLPFPLSYEQAVVMFLALQLFIESYEAVIHEYSDIHKDKEINNSWLSNIETVETAYELRDQLIEQFGIVYE